MLKRLQQARFRVFMMLLMIVFFSHFGPIWEMCVWGLTYAAVTWLECYPLQSLRWRSHPLYAVSALAMLAGTTAVFVFPVVLWGWQGGPMGIANSAFLLSGAMLNTVMSTRGCKVAFGASFAPLCIYLLVAAAEAAGPAMDLAAFSNIAIGGAAMAVTAVKLWSDASRTRTSELKAQAILLERDAQLAQALSRAEAANQAKTTFLANISHEIRTPLNGVLGMAQVMADEPLSATQHARVAVIAESGRNLLGLLNDLLDISKVEAGKLELETIEFNLEEILTGALSTVRVQARAKCLTVDYRMSDEAAGTYLGDPNRLRQIILNLATNAVKFTPQGHVDIDVSYVDNHLTLAVKDTGIGIPPDRQNALFTPFTQAENSTTRRFGGTGLGLAITREIVLLMGGEISLSSLEGKGSTFTVRLPLPRVGTPAPALPHSKQIASFETHAGAVRVLAAEDNPTNQLVLKALLDIAGMQTTIVGDGASAVAAWERDAFDVILMDIQMPEMDGLTATQWIRERERTLGRAHTPIIGLTANVMTHQISSYAAAGMDGHVAKPIQIEMLFEAIHSVLQTDEPAEQRLAS